MTGDRRGTAIPRVVFVTSETHRSSAGIDFERWALNGDFPGASTRVVHDPATDTLLYSSRHQDWLILIDHKTGDVLWKLGHDGDFTKRESTGDIF